MTDPILNDVRLQVDVSEPRNLLRNPSGSDGARGWSVELAGVVLTGQSGIESEDGTCFQAPAVATSSRFIPHLVPVTAGYWLGSRATTRALAAGSRRIQVATLWYDALGVPIPPTSIISQTRTGTQNDLHIGAVQVPANAAYALVQFAIGDEGTEPRPAMNLGKIQLRTAPTAAETNQPYVPADWRDLTGKTFQIKADHGADLEGVQDVLVVGRLSAGISDATIDPATSSALRRGRPIRLQGRVGSAWRGVWGGTIENATANYKDALKIDLTATDVALDLNNAPMIAQVSGNFAAQSARAAIAAGLTVYDGAKIVIPAGNNTIVARDASAKAATWLRRACNTHKAGAWVDAGGYLQSRLLSALSAVPAVTLTDQSPGASTTTVSYTDIDLNYGSLALVNALDVVRYNVAETDEGEQGVKTYGPYVASESERINGRVSGQIEITDGTPSVVASNVLPVFATPRVFPESITINPRSNPGAIFGVVGPYTAARVVNGTYDQVVRILKVAHTITERGWLITYTPRPLETPTATAVTTPSAGADTGPGDVIPPTPGILGSRYRSNNYNIASGAYVTIALDAFDWMDGITWDAANNRFVIPQDGRYQINAGFRVAGGAGVRAVRVVVNGSYTVGEVAAGAAEESVVLSRVVKLKTGDVVAMQGLQYVSNPAAVFGGGSNKNTYMDVSYVGP